MCLIGFEGLWVIIIYHHLSRKLAGEIVMTQCFHKESVDDKNCLGLVAGDLSQPEDVEVTRGNWVFKTYIYIYVYILSYDIICISVDVCDDLWNYQFGMARCCPGHGILPPFLSRQRWCLSTEDYFYHKEHLIIVTVYRPRGAAVIPSDKLRDKDWKVLNS